MNCKRIHFIKIESGWIVYFCDLVCYKYISNEEKECYEFILNGAEYESIHDNMSTINRDTYDRCFNDLLDNGECAVQIPEEKLRLTLNVANSCNMDCGYCYANGGTYHSAENLMSMDTAVRAIDIFVKHFGEIGSIKFIGGEPLINKTVVCKICDYVYEKCANGLIPYMPDFIIATNGTILDDQLIEYSIKYNWRVGLSFDGPESIHSIVRTFRDGTSTAPLIKKNIKRWKEATNGRCPSSVNACYSGVHQQNDVSVIDAIKYMKETLGIEKVNIVPVDASKDSSFSLIDDSCFVSAIKDILDSTSPDYRKYLFTKLKKMEKMLKLHYSMPKHICKAGITTFGVSTKGVISPCHMLTDENGFYMGTVENPDVFSDETFIHIQNQLLAFDRYTSPKCSKCFANRLCVGCLGGNEFRTGNPYKSDPVVCSMIKGAVEELVKDLVREQINNE